MQASITLQHNTLHFYCQNGPPPSRRCNLTDSMFTEQMPDLLDYISNFTAYACHVVDMNIHFDNPLQSLTKQTLTTLNLHSAVQVINKPTHKCGHIIDRVLTHLNQTIVKLSRISRFQPQSSTSYWTVRNMANIDRPSFNAKLFSVSEFSSDETANQFCEFLRTVLDKHAPPLSAECHKSQLLSML